MILQDACYRKKDKTLSISREDAEALRDELNYLIEEVDDHQFAQGTSFHNLEVNQKHWPIDSLLVYPNRPKKKEILNAVHKNLCDSDSDSLDNLVDSIICEPDQSECQNEKSRPDSVGWFNKTCRFIFSRSSTRKTSGEESLGRRETEIDG